MTLLRERATLGRRKVFEVLGMGNFQTCLPICLVRFPVYLRYMKTPPLLIFIHSCLLLLASCQSNPSLTSKQQSAGDSSKIDSSRSNAGQTANPLYVARDSTREATTENYDTLDPATRGHFHDVQAFLEFMKRPNSDNDLGFKKWIKNFRIRNVDSFLNFIAADSLEIEDADRGPGYLKYSRSMLRQQLTSRRGAAFDLIGAVSLQYSLPYPHTIFSIDKTDSIPNLNVTFSEFILYFHAEKDSTAYKLYRLESDHIFDL